MERDGPRVVASYLSVIKKFISSMCTFWLKFRERVLQVVARALFYSGLLRVINFLINRFQPKKRVEGGFSFPFIRKRKSNNLQVLMYHKVNNEYDPFFPATPIDVFVKQMEYLSSHFHTCSLEEAVERLQRKDLPDNAIVVTFDDGYKDNYVHAYPILKQFSLPATIFLATDAIEFRKTLWHDRVLSAFRETNKRFLAGYGDSTTYSLTTMQEKNIAQFQVRRFLRSLDEVERSLWIDRLMEQLKIVDRRESPNLMLNWDEIKIMQRSGISFGSHTISHPNLARLSVEKVREEVWESKKVIEQRLGVAVRTFAYPNGTREDFNETTKRVLRDAGYTCALTTIFGVNEKCHDLFEMKRGTPRDWDIRLFALRLNYYKFNI